MSSDIRATPPAPEPGEVADLVEWLGVVSEQFRIAKLVYEAELTDRAATLLQQLSAPASAVVPVAVSERLPGEGDCDAEGRCWWFDGDWHLKQVRYRGAYDAHWLPAHAIPLPQAGEVEA